MPREISSNGMLKLEYKCVEENQTTHCYKESLFSISNQQSVYNKAYREYNFFALKP